MLAIAALVVRAKVWKQPRCPSVQTRHPNCGAAACRSVGSWKWEALHGLRRALRDTGSKKKKGKEGRKERKKRNVERGRKEGKKMQAKNIYLCYSCLNKEWKYVQDSKRSRSEKGGVGAARLLCLDLVFWFLNPVPVLPTQNKSSKFKKSCSEAVELKPRGSHT